MWILLHYKFITVTETVQEEISLAEVPQVAMAGWEWVMTEWNLHYQQNIFSFAEIWVTNVSVFI